MSIFKRGGIYWYEFVQGGRRYRKSTDVKNQRAAAEIERAFRTALAKGEVGITERKFAPSFDDAMAGNQSKLAGTDHAFGVGRQHSHGSRGQAGQLSQEDGEATRRTGTAHHHVEGVERHARLT